MDSDPQEHSDLLKNRNNEQKNGNVRHEEMAQPADGGFKAYTVMVASFLTNGLVFSVINSFGLIFNVLEIDLKKAGDANAGARAALVGALGMGATFFMSPFAGILTTFMGLRWTAVLGGCIATTGMLISSFFVNNVNVLYFTYGIMYGTGASLAYTPSLAILSSYFKKRLGLINGFVTLGSSFFTVILPPLMQYMIDNHGLSWLFRLLALLTFIVVLCGLLFQPIPIMVVKRNKNSNNCKTICETLVNKHIWKINAYKYWALCMPIALFGYFVPYIHIQKLVETNFTNAAVNIPLQCIAFASGVGRLIFGFLADRPGINRIMLQQISFYIIGILTIIIPFVRNFPLLVAISLGMGLFDGAFISLIGPVAVELCGGAYAAQSIGCMLGMAATPICIGPPLAAYLYSLENSYTLPFVLAGVSPIVGATLMFSTRFARKSDRRKANANGNTPLSSVNTEQAPGPLLKNGKAYQQSTM